MWTIGILNVSYEVLLLNEHQSSFRVDDRQIRVSERMNTVLSARLRAYPHSQQTSPVRWLSLRPQYIYIYISRCFFGLLSVLPEGKGALWREWGEHPTTRFHCLPQPSVDNSKEAFIRRACLFHNVSSYLLYRLQKSRSFSRPRDEI